MENVSLLSTGKEQDADSHLPRHRTAQRKWISFCVMKDSGGPRGAADWLENQRKIAQILSLSRSWGKLWLGLDYSRLLRPISIKPQKKLSLQGQRQATERGEGRICTGALEYCSGWLTRSHTSRWATNDAKESHLGKWQWQVKHSRNYMGLSTTQSEIC